MTDQELKWNRRCVFWGDGLEGSFEKPSRRSRFRRWLRNLLAPTLFIVGCGCSLGGEKLTCGWGDDGDYRGIPEPAKPCPDRPTADAGFWESLQ